MRFGKLITFAIACASAATLAPPALAASETITVTRFDDPAPNGCTPTDCSLREAVIVSNTDPADRDTINLAPGTYVLSIPGSGGFQGDLDLWSAVDIVNTGQEEVLINANGIATGERAIEVVDLPPADIDVTLHGVSISSGVAPVDGDNVARGGAVRVGAETTFWMLGGRIVSSSADRTSPNTGQGGAIWSAGSVLLVETVVSQNSALGGTGGAIFVADGGVNASYAVIERNEASLGGAVGSDGGNISLFASRVARNEATSGGGGGHIVNGGLSLQNSTLAENSSGTLGGGIRVIDGIVNIASSTVTRNEASSGGGFSVHDNAGGSEGRVVLQNSIVGGNVDTIGLNGSRPDCDASDSAWVISLGYNLVSESQGCISPTTGDLIGAFQGHPKPIPPKLRPGAWNGGRVNTEALKPNSPAVDAGDPGSSCQEEDARNFPRDLAGRCDIGAYELAYCRGVVVNRIGSEHGDRPEGTFAPSDGPDGILGLLGPDEISGSPKADGLCGGDGDDTLKGKKGNDLLKGGPGHDICVGGPGKDKAEGCEVERSIP